MEDTIKMDRNLMDAVAMVAIASLYANLLLSAFAVRELQTEMIKIAILIAAMMVSRNWKFGFVMTTITFTRLMNSYASDLKMVQEHFDISTFAGNFGLSIVLKGIGSLIVVGVLLVLYRNADQTYLRWGDLNRVAKEINWLGIQADTITWKKLSFISGGLIAFGTILLTFVTVLGQLDVVKFAFFLSRLPLILLFAVGNSFCEGILFRNAILGPLNKVLDEKKAVGLSAIFFGSFHYYGAPGGIVGVIMSSVLGWFLARSMVETEGLLAPWIIHFMQDFIIFSMIALLGGFVA